MKIDIKNWSYIYTTWISNIIWESTFYKTKQKYTFLREKNCLFYKMRQKHIIYVSTMPIHVSALIVLSET